MTKPNPENISLSHITAEFGFPVSAAHRPNDPMAVVIVAEAAADDAALVGRVVGGVARASSAVVVLTEDSTGGPSDEEFELPVGANVQTWVDSDEAARSAQLLSLYETMKATRAAQVADAEQLAREARARGIGACAISEIRAVFGFPDQLTRARDELDGKMKAHVDRMALLDIAEARLEEKRREQLVQQIMHAYEDGQASHTRVIAVASSSHFDDSSGFSIVNALIAGDIPFILGLQSEPVES